MKTAAILWRSSVVALCSALTGSGTLDADPGQLRRHTLRLNRHASVNAPLSGGELAGKSIRLTIHLTGDDVYWFRFASKN